MEGPNQPVAGAFRKRAGHHGAYERLFRLLFENLIRRAYGGTRCKYIGCEAIINFSFVTRRTNTFTKKRGGA